MADSKTSLLDHRGRGHADNGGDAEYTNLLRSSSPSLSWSSTQNTFGRDKCLPALRRQIAVVTMYLLLGVLAGVFILSK